MTTSSAYNDGLRLVTRAIEFDQKRQSKEAIATYKQAVELFLVADRCERNARNRAVIQAKIGEYLDRCEQLTNTDDESARTTRIHATVFRGTTVRFADIAGADAAKQALTEACILPMRLPDMFVGKRRPWRCILLYGPSGTGKSFLAQAVAGEMDSATFFSITSADIMSRYVGDSEKMIRALFETASNEKRAIIFIDEIDSLGRQRTDDEMPATRSVKTQLLTEIDGVRSKMDNIVVLAATNVPWQLDTAIRRRFEKRIYVPLPDRYARRTIFERQLTPDVVHTLTKADLADLADRADGYSCADLVCVMRDAMMQPMRTLKGASHFRQRDNKWSVAEANDADAIACALVDLPETTTMDIELPAVTRGDVERALANNKPTVKSSDLQAYRDFEQQFSSE